MGSVSFAEICLVTSLFQPVFTLQSRNHYFFLKRAGELHINILRRKKGKRTTGCYRVKCLQPALLQIDVCPEITITPNGAHINPVSTFRTLDA